MSRRFAGVSPGGDRGAYRFVDNDLKVALSQAIFGDSTFGEPVEGVVLGLAADDNSQALGQLGKPGVDRLSHGPIESGGNPPPSLDSHESLELSHDPHPPGAVARRVDDGVGMPRQFSFDGGAEHGPGLENISGEGTLEGFPRHMVPQRPSLFVCKNGEAVGIADRPEVMYFPVHDRG